MSVRTLTFVRKLAKILSCCALVMAAPVPAMAQPEAQVAPGDPSLCTDQMETEPGTDDLQAIPIAELVEDGCLAIPQPISV